MTYEQKLAAYILGDWCCIVPTVCTARWDADSWIKWIDKHGIWMKGKEHEGDQG